MWLSQLGDPPHSLQKLKVEASGEVLGKVKCKLGCSEKTLFSPSPDLKR